MRRLVLLLLVVGVGTARADELDVGAWLKARGASADPERSFNWQNAICSEVAVGPHHETALECHEEEYVSRDIPGEAVPANRNVVHILLRVVRDKKLVTLIDVPVRTFSEDAQPRPMNVTPPPWHPFEIAKDGLSIVVGDPKDATACKSLADREESRTLPRSASGHSGCSNTSGSGRVTIDALISDVPPPPRCRHDVEIRIARHVAVEQADRVDGARRAEQRCQVFREIARQPHLGALEHDHLRTGCGEPSSADCTAVPGILVFVPSQL